MKDAFSVNSDSFDDIDFKDSTAEVILPKSGVKRAFDVIASLLLIVLLSPFLLIVAFAIRLDSPGSVIFRQPRHGLNGKTITVSKFRSMRIDMTDVGGAVQAKHGDVRVTAVGRFLRRTCIDELPQLWDVLVGKMSLVGPRPHPIGMRVDGVLFTDLVRDSDKRLRMRPGLTGLAQIKGNRGPVHTEAIAHERVALDNEYIDNWSLLLDVQILLRTAILPFRKGCY